MTTTLTKYKENEYLTTRVARHTGSLGRSSSDYLIGSFGGVEIYIGIDFYDAIDPADHPEKFADYSKHEMKEFQSYWSWWDAKYGKTKYKKPRLTWGLASLSIYAFANNIQIGEQAEIKHEIPCGFTPEANRLDTGELVWTSPEEAMELWVSENSALIEDYAEIKRLEALTLFAESLEKLTK